MAFEVLNICLSDFSVYLILNPFSSQSLPNNFFLGLMDFFSVKSFNQSLFPLKFCSIFNDQFQLNRFKHQHFRHIFLLSEIINFVIITIYKASLLRLFLLMLRNKCSHFSVELSCFFLFLLFENLFIVVIFA